MECEKKMSEKKFVFGTENLARSAKENFIGTVTYAKLPCDCEDCRKGAEKVLEETGRVAPDRLHIKIQPIDGTYEKEQQQWYVPTKTIVSRWGEFNKRLEEMGLVKELNEKGVEALIGKTFEWEWVSMKVGVKPQREVEAWMPKRLLTEEEVKKFGGGAGEPNYG